MSRSPGPDACTHARTHARTHTLTQTHTHAHTITHKITQTHTHIGTHTETHRHTHAHTRTRSPTRAHTHTHASACCVWDTRERMLRVGAGVGLGGRGEGVCHGVCVCVWGGGGGHTSDDAGDMPAANAASAVSTRENSVSSLRTKSRATTRLSVPCSRQRRTNSSRHADLVDTPSLESTRSVPDLRRVGESADVPSRESGRRRGVPTAISVSAGSVRDWMMGCWRGDSADTDVRHRPAPRYTTRVEADCGEAREAPGEQFVQPLL